MAKKPAKPKRKNASLVKTYSTGDGSWLDLLQWWKDQPGNASTATVYRQGRDGFEEVGPGGDGPELQEKIDRVRRYIESGVNAQALYDAMDLGIKYWVCVKRPTDADAELGLSDKYKLAEDERRQAQQGRDQAQDTLNGMLKNIRQAQDDGGKGTQDRWAKHYPEWKRAAEDIINRSVIRLSASEISRRISVHHEVRVNPITGRPFDYEKIVERIGPEINDLLEKKYPQG